MFRIILLFIGICLFSCSKEQHTIISELSENWKFKNVKDTLWLQATVPGTVHTDLLKNNLIKDPFLGTHEDSLQWIGEQQWQYKNVFQVEKSQLNKENHTLIFQGLDTYANVWLNDTLIVQADNAFRTWKVDVSKIIREENTLAITFQSPIAIDSTKAKMLSYELPVSGRVFSRKPQFHYGWDWGPTFVTSGIWRPIVLESWDMIQLNDVYIRQLDLNDTIAKLKAEVDLHSISELDMKTEVWINGKKKTEQQAAIVPGTQKTHIDFEIKNPKKWWTHNLGEPYLYDIELKFYDGRNHLFSKKVKKGLRTIELVTEKDSIGSAFYFKLNGKPVFMKGANYIPQHIFQPEVSIEDYQKIFEDVIAANMNMLRVWGGGIYEEDIFYELADEKGILIWQDFMFACAMYPGDPDFMNNVKQEAIDNIKRLRNHSSIALWCGNNENNEAWHNWGWQSKRSKEEKDEIWTNYKKLFNDLLPDLVNKLTTIDYWESSPKLGRGDKRFKTEGDAHDWGVWHDEYPFERFETEVPRFMSEFGFQSFPSYQAIKYFTGSDSVDIQHPSFDTHQKHPRGFELIRKYMERDFPVPDNDEDYVYVSQLLQAYGMTKGIVAQRKAMPYCMGSLYWQLNDCWPVVSWSGMDGLGNWKALHYQAGESFRNILPVADVKEDTLSVTIVNDQLKDLKDTLHIKAINFEGEVLWSEQKEVSVRENSSTEVFRVKLPQEVRQLKSTSVISLTYGKESSFNYLVKPKELQLPEEKLMIDVQKSKGGYEVRISSQMLQKDVYLYTDSNIHFQTNFFDLLPGKQKRIMIDTDLELNREAIHYKTLNGVMARLQNQ